jgi:anti-sigma factor RsiW
MNCREWEERLALYAGDDLAGPDALEVERHVAGCPGCQVAASGFKQAMETLREAHADEPPDAAFAAVRARVIGTLANERRPVWRRWAYALAAAAAVVLAVGVWVRPSPAPPVAIVRPPERPVEARSVGQSPESTGGPDRVAKAVAPRRVRHGATRRLRAVAGAHENRAPAPRETVEVRLVTDNPDVVILWIAETRGE